MANWVSRNTLSNIAGNLYSSRSATPVCERSSLSSRVRTALSAADIVLIAPSNPWLSLAPILAVKGMRDLLISLDVPIVAVTPIIGGAAVKGPTAKIMSELGQEVTAANIANFYTGIINGFVNDIQNEPLGPSDLRSHTSEHLDEN